ncbi:hypothetical protein BgiBS90_019157, partial [Biomphalaria glabrata]
EKKHINITSSMKIDSQANLTYDNNTMFEGDLITMNSTFDIPDEILLKESLRNGEAMIMVLKSNRR